MPALKDGSVATRHVWILCYDFHNIMKYKGKLRFGADNESLRQGTLAFVEFAAMQQRRESNYLWAFGGLRLTTGIAEAADCRYK